MRWMQPSVRTAPHRDGCWRAHRRRTRPPEAEVDPDGTVLITLVRAVGWLSRMDLRSRPVPALGSLCPGARYPVRSKLAWPGVSAMSTASPSRRATRARCLGVSPDRTLSSDQESRSCRSSPRTCSSIALKPADAGVGVVLRLLNLGSDDRRPR